MSERPTMDDLLADDKHMAAHGPTDPFSCPYDFGPTIGPIGGSYADMRLHNCDLASGHRGDHHCECGWTGCENAHHPPASGRSADA